jgi:tetratricopeptide (TPR) repeat protein
LVERRLYLPFFALVLILFEPLRRLKIRPLYLASALALVCCVAAFATWNRVHVWGNTTDLFRDAVAKAPNKARVHIGYANALYHEGRCQQAVDEFLTASRLKTPDFVLYFNLGAAYACANRPDDAIAMLTKSLALRLQAPAFSLIGQLQSKQGKYVESLASFYSSLIVDSKYSPTYAYRAGVHRAMGHADLAYKDYMECLRLDPQNRVAQEGLASLNKQR